MARIQANFNKGLRKNIVPPFTNLITIAIAIANTLPTHPPTNKPGFAPQQAHPPVCPVAIHFLYTSTHLIDICAPLQVLSTTSPLSQSHPAATSILGYNANVNGKRASNAYSGAPLMVLGPPRHRLSIHLDVD